MEITATEKLRAYSIELDSLRNYQTSNHFVQQTINSRITFLENEIAFLTSMLGSRS